MIATCMPNVDFKSELLASGTAEVSVSLCFPLRVVCGYAEEEDTRRSIHKRSWRRRRRRKGDSSSGNCLS